MVSLGIATMRSLQQMVADRGEAKRIWGKGLPVELMIKVATNSCYGKLAQDVAGRRNLWSRTADRRVDRPRRSRGDITSLVQRPARHGEPGSS